MLALFLKTKGAKTEDEAMLDRSRFPIFPCVCRG